MSAKASLSKFQQSTESLYSCEAMMSCKVAILGGGVGGLSAAHELIERGFAVSVFERSNLFGGKARSIYVPTPEPGVVSTYPVSMASDSFPRFISICQTP